MSKKYDDEFISECYRWYTSNAGVTVYDTAEKYGISYRTLSNRFFDLSHKSRRKNNTPIARHIDKDGKIILTRRRLFILKRITERLLNDWKEMNGILSKFCDNIDDEIELAATLEWLFQYVESRENEIQNRLRKQQ